MDDSKFLIIGGNGQLGRALQEKYPNAQQTDVAELDITSAQAVNNYDWSKVKVILNASGYTNVDGAETPEGKQAAFAVNAEAVNNLAKAAQAHDLTLIHISTDYVFNGKQKLHDEEEVFQPLNVYGASKAEGDKFVQSVPKHYLLRTSWVIGDGKNFVRTMLELGKKGVNPTVISDQIGRLTFTTELVRAIDYLLSHRAPFGTYNISNDGDSVSWAEITREIFKDAGFDKSVQNTSSVKYYKGKQDVARRPLQSTLDLSKIKATGFTPRDWRDNLRDYIRKELSV